MRFTVVCLLVLTACAQTTTTRIAYTDTESMPEKIIDAHVHLDQVWSKGSVDELAQASIAGVVAHAPKGDPTPGKPGREFPFQVKLCAAVAPGATVAQVEKAIADGRVSCLKVYLGYVKKWASDPFYLPFYALAEKRGVVVVFHTGDTYDKAAHVKYADPLTVDEIATRYPKVKFVLAHLGNPWLQSAAEVAYKNDNVYVDVSALMIEDVSTRPPEVVDELVVKPMRWAFFYVENPKKFLFGTDWPLTRVGPYVDLVKQAIPAEHWKAVFYQNAVDLFGFSMPKRK